MLCLCRRLHTPMEFTMVTRQMLIVEVERLQRAIQAYAVWQALIAPAKFARGLLWMGLPPMPARYMQSGLILGAMCQ